MGNCISKRKEAHPVTFDSKEMELLNRVFTSCCNLYPEFNTSIILELENIIPSQCDLLIQYSLRTLASVVSCLTFWWCMVDRRSISQSKPLSNFVSNESHYLVELMLKENFTSSNPELRGFDKFELMALVSIENTLFMTDREELKKL